MAVTSTPQARSYLLEALCHFDGAVLLTSHDRHFAAAVATRCVEIVDGTLVDSSADATDDPDAVDDSDAVDTGSGTDSDGGTDAVYGSYAAMYGITPSPTRRQGRDTAGGRRRRDARKETRLARMVGKGAAGRSAAPDVDGRDAVAARLEQVSVEDEYTESGVGASGKKSGSTTTKRKAGLNSQAHANPSRRGGGGRNKKAKGTPFWKGVRDSKGRYAGKQK